MATKYDVISPGSVKLEYPDFWSSVNEVAGKWLDPEFLNQLSQQEEEQRRYDKEQFIAGQEREEEQNRYNTKQQQLIHDKKYSQAMSKLERQRAVAQSEWEMAADHPDVQEMIAENWGPKTVSIPQPDGSVKTEHIFPQEWKNLATKKKNIKETYDADKENFSFPVGHASGFKTVEEKISAGRRLLSRAPQFNEDLSYVQKDLDLLRDYEENLAMLNNLDLFMPEGYTNKPGFKLIKDTLLQGGGITDAEMELLAGDISTFIGDKDKAAKFWADWTKNVGDSLGRTDFSKTAPGIISSLKSTYEHGIKNLDKHFPGVATGILKTEKEKEEFRLIAEQLGQDMYGQSFIDGELDEEKMNEIAKLAKIEVDKASIAGGIQQRIIDLGKKGGWQSTQTEKDVPTTKVETRWEEPGGLPAQAKNPVTGKWGPIQNIRAGINNKPRKYAEKGIIASDEYPFYKETTVKEALQSLNGKPSKSTRTVWEADDYIQTEDDLRKIQQKVDSGEYKYNPRTKEYTIPGMNISFTIEDTDEGKRMFVKKP
jgi:hypothetical protein